MTRMLKQEAMEVDAKAQARPRGRKIKTSLDLAKIILAR